MKPDKQKILMITSIILLAIVVFTLSFFMVLIDRGFYDKSFARYGAYDSLGVDGPRLIVDNLIKYLISENREIKEQPALALFTENEQAHLEDVQAKIVFLKYFGIASLVLLGISIFLLRKSKDLIKVLKKVSLISAICVFAVIIILFLLSLDFSPFFDTFHQALFPQGNYSFQQDSLLITLFPEQFFSDYAKKMFFHSAILGLVLVFLGSTAAFPFDDARRRKMRKP